MSTICQVWFNVFVFWTFEVKTRTINVHKQRHANCKKLYTHNAMTTFILFDFRHAFNNEY